MKLFKLLAVTAFILLAGSMVSCKKSSDASAAKTLNKSTLTSKAWYNQGGSIIHDFRGNNVYSNTGTWRWVNNSDTLKSCQVQGALKPIGK